MFLAHGWDAPADKMMTSAPRLLVGTYGSIARFEQLHEMGDQVPPMEAIYGDPPNVWLTSFYRFHPEEWGFLGFTDEAARQRFIERSRPGVLVVIYGAGEASKADRGRIIGIQQCSHVIGSAEEFMAPDAWIAKAKNLEWAGRWNFAVKAIRAWRVLEGSRMEVRDFAPQATATEAWQHIGARGVPLTGAETKNILKLNLEEIPVFGRNYAESFSVGSAKDVLAPSRAGPVSKCPFVTRESEGPKHLYVLVLRGDADAFLGDSANGRFIIKAGFSGHPVTRCDDHNRTLPDCAFSWEILRSGDSEGRQAYATSDHAKAGERAMQHVLCRQPSGRSLGGEFFLADEALIEEAWQAGNEAARVYVSQ